MKTQVHGISIDTFTFKFKVHIMIRPQNLKEWEIVFQIFVAFSENLNFNFTTL